MTRRSYSFIVAEMLDCGTAFKFLINVPVLIL